MNNLMTMEQMDTDSVPKVTKVSNVISALDPMSKSLNTFPGSCETIEGTTSFASNYLRRKSLQENTHLGAPDSGVEADNSNDIHVTNSEVSGGCKNSEDNVLPCESINANTTADDMNDVKVCDICGDVGYEDMLVICSECNAGAEHIYCMQTLLYAVPEGDWFCDDCKLKNKGRDQRKSIIDSPTLSSFSRDAEKQVGNENSALKVSSSGKFKLSSDKMQMQKSAHNSVVHCKRQRGDSNDAPANRKQVIECDNVPVKASQPLLQRNSSCKAQETIRADSCGDLPQIKISVSPPYTSDGSSKMSGAGKFDSYAMTPLANKNSMPRSFSRENSFKNAETAKVKFLPTHTVASLCSGMASRESSKFTGVDGNTDAASPQTGIIDSRQISFRGRSNPMIDSAGPLVNRSAHQSYFRSSSAYSCLQSAGLSKSEDAFPSFLLSSRLNAPCGHSNLRSSKEAINGNWQLELAGNSSGTMGTTRGDGPKSCVPVSSNYSKDYKIIASGNDEVNGILKHSSGTFAFNSSIVKKSNVDISAQHVLISGSSKSDELTLAKANSHLRSPSAKKCSAVLTEVLQPQKLMCEDLKGHAMAKLSPEGLILTNKAVEGLACAEHPNVLDSDKESPGGMKPMKGIINMSELSHKKNGNQLPASVLVEDDRVLTPSVVSTRMELVMEDKAVLDVLKDRLPKVDSSLLIEESEVSMLSKEDCKCREGKVTVTIGEDPKLSVSNKKVAPGSLVKKTNEMGTPETSNMSLDKDRVNDSSSTLLDNTSAFRLKSTPVSLVNDSNLVEASKTSSALLWTKQNIFSEMVLGRNDGKMEIKPTSNVIVKGNSNLSTYIINEANAKPINGFCKDPFSLGGSLEKDVIPSSIPHKFGRNISMATQSDKSMIQPSEINLSASALVQTPVHSPSSKNYAMGVPLQDMFDFTPTKLPTWPESLFLWRGGFEIIDKISGHKVFDGMQAHPSNKASPKVYEVSRKFPSQLLLEQVQRYDAWPKRFQECPPTDEDIALYILPVETESCKIQYFELLEATIKQDLALRVYLECAELLIFSSNQLPESYHRCNGRMYLWGVFRGGKKIHMADPQRQFPDCNNVGSNVVQPSSSSLLMKNQNPLPRHLTSITTSGCSEGEEDMDVDMEGGREIGMAETPAPRAKSCPANVIESNTMKKSVLSNSKPLLSHHENFKSGSCMPLEQDNLSLATSRSGSAKIFGKIPEGEEAIDVDIEVGREIGMAERPKESQLANVIKSSATQTFVLSNSKPIISHHYNSESGRHIPFEQGHFSSIASRSASAKILGKIPEYMFSTSYVEDGKRRNEQSRSYDAINELDFPPGFELPPVFRHSSAISRNNPGKHIEAMFENTNSFGIHSKLQGWELSPSLGLPNDIMESSDTNLAPGFFSQGWNCPPSTVLESEEFPPGFNSASLKPSVSSPDCPPGLELYFMKSLVSSPNCPRVLEPSFMKSLMSSPVCPPGLGPTYIKPLVSSAECPPGLVATSVTSPDRPPGLELTSTKPLVSSPDCPSGLELTSMKPLVSSPDCPPGLEPASMKPLLCSPDCLPGLETTSMTPLVFSVECSPGLEAASVKPSGTSPDCPPSLEPAVGNPWFSLHFSHGTDPANGMLNLSSSECPLGFESTSWKSLFHSSDDPLENLACKHLQDKPDLEVQNKLEPFCQCSVHLSSGKVDSSRNHTEIYCANCSSGATHSHSLTSVTRKADKDSNAAKMSKKKSFTEEFYYNSSKREKEDKRERSRSRSREKECNWRRSGSSNREKEDRERWRNYSREKEGRRERYINYSRDKEAKKQMDRKHSGEEQDAKNRARKNTERENGRDRDRGYHRHRSRYVGTRRHKDHEKHSHNSFGCSYPESTTVSYSSLGGKCRIDATRKMMSSHHANSSYADSNIEHHSSKRPSLGIYSENGEKAVTVSLLKGKAIMDNDSAQVPHSEHCSLESEEKLRNTDVGRLLTDNDHILLCDLNDENLDQKNLSGSSSQEATQVNISDTMISKTKYSFLHSGKVEQYVIPVESNLSSGSMLTMHDSVQCLKLFPIKGNCGAAETSLSDWDLSLELGLGQRTANKEPLPLLEQSSSQSLCCNFMLNNGSRTSRSRSVCDDSWEANPVEASILSLSMPRYRKQGNSWVEVAKDSELSEEVDANLKLTLSMVQKD